jgi:MFS family permease
MLSGRLTDIFGRRYFFMGASAVGFVGCIVGATAKTIPQLIGAEVITGSAAGSQLSFFWIISEIVPMNRRMLANAAMFLFSTPTNTLAPMVAYGFQYHTTIKWRGCFWFMVAMNVASFMCWFLFYRPPSFKMLHQYKTPLELAKKFDYVGLGLFTAGLVLFLMGISWVGTSKSYSFIESFANVWRV